MEQNYGLSWLRKGTEMSKTIFKSLKKKKQLDFLKSDLIQEASSVQKPKGVSRI